MPFHIIKSKKYCNAYVIDGKLIENPSFEYLDATWSFSKKLEQYPHIKYCELLAAGKPLIDFVSEETKKENDKNNIRLKAFIKAFKSSGVSFNFEYLFDYVPMSFVEDFYAVKNKMLAEFLKFDHDDSLYSFYLENSKMLSDIEIQNLNIPNYNQNILYNLFGSLTGRLTMQKKSFPILTLPKCNRNIIKATNDFLLELDFNAVEPRVYLGLINQNQPEIDIHTWHQKLYKTSFSENVSREEMKEKFFAWFYGYKNDPFGIDEIDKIYNKNKILSQYWNNNIITTIYGKKFEAPYEKAFNNIVQSTAALMFLEQAIQINKFLKQNNAKSFIKFLIHDSLVIDFSKE